MIYLPDDVLPDIETQVSAAVSDAIAGQGVISGSYPVEFEDALFRLSSLGRAATQDDIAEVTAIGLRTMPDK